MHYGLTPSSSSSIIPAHPDGLKPNEKMNHVVTNSNKSSSKVVDTADEGNKLHKYIRAHFSILIPSKKQAHAAFKNKQILVNDRPGFETQSLSKGDVVSVLRDIDDVHKSRTATVPVEVCHIK
jgi:hypothetical protein